MSITVPKFKIHQIAIIPNLPTAAMDLLAKLGLTEWVTDVVTAHGSVFGAPVDESKANLHFNYQAGGTDEEAKKPLEFEVLDYHDAQNWVDASVGRNVVSHIGTHCTAEELELYCQFFAEEGIKVAQELFTDDHTNEHIRGKRQYHYVIFDTRSILGVDLKFIVRQDI